MNDCIFCKLANKEIPAELILETADCVVLPDKNPKAPVHWLAIPKKHIESVAHMNAAEAADAGALVLAAKTAAQNNGLADYKLIFNAGKYAKIPHLHLHILAGTDLGEVI